jgi:hypothetical protein
MSDGVMERLVAALNRNSDLLESIGKGGKIDKPAAEEDAPRRRRGAAEDKPAAEEDAPRRRRGAAADDKPAAEDKGMSAEDFKKAVEKFVNVDSDDEYDRRVAKTIDPTLDKADVKELKDLPKKYWQDILDAIEAYGKDGGSRRRSV